MASAGIIFGRLNPPTTGHLRLLRALEALDVDAKFIYLSHTCDKKKNPLDYNRKHEYVDFIVKESFSDIEAVKSDARTIIETLEEVYLKGFDDVVILVGDDRLDAFKELVTKYNGAPNKDGEVIYRFDSIDVRALERDESQDSDVGMSASKVRQMVVDDDYESFKNSIPTKDLGILEDMWGELRSVLAPSAVKPRKIEEHTANDTDGLVGMLRDNLTPEQFSRIAIFDTSENYDQVIDVPEKGFLFMMKPTASGKELLNQLPRVDKSDEDFIAIMDALKYGENGKYSKKKYFHVSSSDHLKYLDGGKKAKYNKAKGSNGLGTEKQLASPEDHCLDDFLEIHSPYDEPREVEYKVQQGKRNSKILKGGMSAAEFLLGDFGVNRDAGADVSDIDVKYKGIDEVEHISVKDFSGGKSDSAFIINLGLGGSKGFLSTVDALCKAGMVNPEYIEDVKDALSYIATDLQNGIPDEKISYLMNTVKFDRNSLASLMARMLKKAWLRDGLEGSYSYLGVLPGPGGDKPFDFEYMSAGQAYEKYALGLDANSLKMRFSHKGMGIDFRTTNAKYSFNMRNRNGSTSANVALDFCYTPLH